MATTSTNPEDIAIAARAASAGVRASAGRLRSSLEIIEARAAVVSSAERRRLLARAAAVILDAFAVREAAERTIPKSAPAIYMTLIQQETASLMNAAAMHIRKIAGGAYAALYDKPVALALAVGEDLQFMTEPSKTATPASARQRVAKQEFNRARAGIKPKVVIGALSIIKRKSATDKPMLLATASSDATDLENDYFTIPALRMMCDGFKGKLIFANHSYRVPEDVVGQAVDTALVKRNGRTDLDLKIEIETSNPRAVQIYDMVRNGTRLGVSVGVLVKDARREKDGRLAILDVLPLEASVVGIPANQTAWTQGAKAAK